MTYRLVTLNALTGRLLIGWFMYSSDELDLAMDKGAMWLEEFPNDIVMLVEEEDENALA